MKKRILGVFILSIITLSIVSCKQGGDEELRMEQLVAKNNFVQSIKGAKNKFTKNNNSTITGKRLGQLENVIGDEEIISFETGDIVGDISDTVTISYGPTIYAITEQEELETKMEMLDQINNAKVYLSSHGLDFSDEFTIDDPKYIYTAMIVTQMENTMGIPGEGIPSNPNIVGRQNTLAGCVMQAIGINAIYDAWFGKFATKRLLLAAVGKIATRYLGYVGAAIAVYDFADCMWGGD